MKNLNYSDVIDCQLENNLDTFNFNECNFIEKCIDNIDSHVKFEHTFIMKNEKKLSDLLKLKIKYQKKLELLKTFNTEQFDLYFDDLLEKIRDDKKTEIIT